MNAAETLSTRLDETGQDYRLERDLDEGLLVVRVADADELSPIGSFAARLKEHIEDQSMLLEARERTLLEEALLKQLAQQIHARTKDARDLVATMDADTSSRPMHSVLSGGEKSSGDPPSPVRRGQRPVQLRQAHLPRMIALDEAFAGIDAKYRPDLLELTVKFDLDLFMTGHDLWVTYSVHPADRPL